MVACIASGGCDVVDVLDSDTPEEPKASSTQSGLIGLNSIGLNSIGLNSIGLNSIGLNGIGLNGIGLNSIGLNGIGLNSIGLNGIGLNGIGLNGIGLNGIGLNSIGLNGIGLNSIGLNSIGLNSIGLNGIGLNGVIINGVNLGEMRLNGFTLNGLPFHGLTVNGVNLKGVRLGGLSLNGINLATAKLNGAALTAGQTNNLKLALSYVVKCALPSGQCTTVTDVNGSTYQLCGASGHDPTWNTDVATSVTREHLVANCTATAATTDAANPGNTMTHINHERAAVKDFFEHAVSCALPPGSCVNATDTDGSTYAMCGSEGLDPAWQYGPATQGVVSEQVAACVKTQATGHGDAWMDYREQLKAILQYATQCALREDQSVTVTDWDGASLNWQGSLGLADWWNGAPLKPAPSPKAPSTGEELVSACLMARTNAVGKSVSVSIRARPELIASGGEAAAYGRHEGAFMGNLFSATPVARSCSGPGGSGWFSDPSTNAPMTAGRQCAEGTDCGFEYMGACTSICNVKPGVGGETLFDDCAGNANVVNTFLYSVPAFDVNDTTGRTYASVTGSTDAPMTATGDFNKDGHLDLAIEKGASVVVRLGQKDGSFAADVVHALGSGVTSRTVIAKDLNGDGNLDLVTANQDSFSVLIGSANGTFSAPTKYTVSNAAGALASVAAADFNNDGKQDLAINLVSGAGVFLGTGTGTFGAQISSGSVTNGQSLVTGDFNGDGKMDVASGNSAGNSVYVLWGGGAGTFTSSTTMSFGAGAARARSLAAADFNGDGRTDLAAAVYAENVVRVMLGQSNKTFSSTNYAVAGSGDMSSVQVAFLDGDSSRDLLVGRGSSIVLLSGTPNGTFTTAMTFDAGETTKQVVAGHYDRDALWRADLVASSDAGRLVQLAGI